MDLRNIIIVGDSIARGFMAVDGTWCSWPTILAQRLARQMQTNIGVCNFSVGGVMVPDLVASYAPLAQHVVSPVAILFSAGVNDMTRVVDAGAGNTWAHRVNMNTSINAFRTMLIDARAFTTAPLVVTGLLPVDESKNPFWVEGDLSLHRINQDIDLYNHKLSDVCTEIGVHFMNWGQGIDRASWPDMLVDEVHPNAAGHEFLADVAYNFLKDKIK